MAKLDPYNRKSDYSYCLGLFPCITLMQTRPEKALRLLTHPAGRGNDGVEKLAALCQAHGVRREEAERVLRRESKKDNCFAAIAFEKYTDALDMEKNHAVLCQISDGGNLGTALRSLLGFGIRDVAVIRPCVDVFDPHVLRSSMGAFFKMRVAVFENFAEYREKCGQRALYPFMLDASVPLDQAVAQKKTPFTLIMGNEGSGLPAEFAAMGQPVRIPHNHEIDSLNLSIAAAIGMYTFANH